MMFGDISLAILETPIKNCLDCVLFFGMFQMLNVISHISVFEEGSVVEYTISAAVPKID